MHKRVVLLTSLILALMSVVLLQLWKRNVAREMGFGAETVDLLVAKVDITAWSRIHPEQVEVRAYPLQYLPPGHVPVGMLDELAGRTVGVTVVAGQPVTSLHLAAGAASHRLSGVIPPGHRGLTISVGRTAFVDLVKAGDFVDVLLTLQDPTERTVETRTILQAVAVLAVGNSLGDSGYAARGGGSRRSSRVTDVTLAVSAQEAEMLVLAQNQGELALTMRFAGEVDSDEELAGWRLRDLLGREPIEEIQHVRDRRNCISINEAGKGATKICAE